MINIAVLVSGGGTNLQALIDAQQAGKIENGRIALVVSSNPNAFALERAAKADIPTAVLRRKDFGTADSYAGALDTLLREKGIGLIVLAGFMTVLPDSFCRLYENRIINVHPSLIPSFCGEGYYGLRVHEAALAKGVKVTGATVHFVSEVVDGGAIICAESRRSGGRRHTRGAAAARDGAGGVDPAAAGRVRLLRGAAHCTRGMGRKERKGVTAV